MEIVYAYVVADLLHIGHVIALENAKALGDKLVVGVLTDEATMEKKKKPILSFPERLQIVKSLSCVDVAVPQKTYVPDDNLKNLKPDILVESDSHSDEDLKNTMKLANHLGIRIYKMPYYSEQSSTEIKEKIKDAR